jgi:hypothetical protein
MVISLMRVASEQDRALHRNSPETHESWDYYLLGQKNLWATSGSGSFASA